MMHSCQHEPERNVSNILCPRHDELRPKGGGQREALSCMSMMLLIKCSVSIGSMLIPGYKWDHSGMAETNCPKINSKM